MERQFQTFKHEVSKPGIITSMLDQFEHQNKLKRPAKICIDGKKLSIGIGEQLGEEDLNNHESKPTLQDRTKRSWISNEQTTSQCNITEETNINYRTGVNRNLRISSWNSYVNNNILDAPFL